MIPKNARMPAYKYYNEGNIGRENYLLESDSEYVFVVIDGGIRLEISTDNNNQKSNRHTVMYKRKGKRAMVVEV